MIYTGAPQNTRRKDISELNIDAAWKLMEANDIHDFIIHAPYIINLGNTINPDTYQLATDFLRLELTRADACRSNIMVLHPGAHVGAGVEAGIASVVKGLNEVLTDDTSCLVALETVSYTHLVMPRGYAMFAGAVIVVVIRLLASHYKWNIPRVM